MPNLNFAENFVVNQKDALGPEKGCFMRTLAVLDQ